MRVWTEIAGGSQGEVAGHVRADGINGKVRAQQRPMNSEIRTAVCFLYLLWSDHLLTGRRPGQISHLTEHTIITKS